jgi:hypothetical protein
MKTLFRTTAVGLTMAVLAGCGGGIAHHDSMPIVSHADQLDARYGNNSGDAAAKPKVLRSKKDNTALVASMHATETGATAPNQIRNLERVTAEGNLEGAKFCNSDVAPSDVQQAGGFLANTGSGVGNAAFGIGGPIAASKGNGYLSTTKSNSLSVNSNGGNTSTSAGNTTTATGGTATGGTATGGTATGGTSNAGAVATGGSSTSSATGGTSNAGAVSGSTSGAVSGSSSNAGAVSGSSSNAGAVSGSSSNSGGHEGHQQHGRQDDTCGEGCSALEPSVPAFLRGIMTPPAMTMHG